jgi:hypothetical protein
MTRGAASRRSEEWHLLTCTSRPVSPETRDNTGPATLDPRMFNDPKTDTTAVLLQKLLRHSHPDQSLCPCHQQVIRTRQLLPAAAYPLHRYIDDIDASNQPGIYRGLNGRSLSISKACTCSQVELDLTARHGEAQSSHDSRRQGVSAGGSQ